MTKKKADALRRQAHQLFIAEATLRLVDEEKLADAVLAVAERLRVDANAEEGK